MSQSNTDKTKHSYSARYAIWVALFGWMAFSFADVISKWLTIGYSVPQIICIGNLSGLIITTIWIIAGKGLSGFYTPKWRLHMVRGTMMTAITFCVVSSLALLPLADFYGIVFLSPLTISIASVIFLKEHINIQQLLAIIIGFTGVVILAGPQFNTLNSGLLFAFAAVAFSTINVMVLRKIGHEETIAIYAFFPFLFNTIVSAPFMVTDFTMPTSGDLLMFIAFAPMLLIGLVSLSQAFAKAPNTATIAPFHYSQAIWGALLGYIIFKEIPTTTTIIGATIIVSAGLYLILHERKLQMVTDRA